MTGERKADPKKLGKEGIHDKKIEINNVSISDKYLDNSK